MPLRIAVVENPIMFDFVRNNNKIDEVVYCSKMYNGKIEPYDVRDSDILSNFDVILIEGDLITVENLRRRIKLFAEDAKKDIVISRYHHNSHFDPFGYYQTILVSESFKDVKEIPCKNPEYPAYEAAILAYEDLKHSR